VRWGVTQSEIPTLAKFLAQALKTDTPEMLAPEVAAYRQQFQTVHFAV